MRRYLPTLVILPMLGLSPALQAGPQTGNQTLDLEMLDLNGTPFRTFHLGHYQQELDASRPTTATTLPSATLRGVAAPLEDDPGKYTGMTADTTDPAPQKLDMDRLMPGYGEELSQPRR